MKATLEFTLPEETLEHKIHMQAPDLHAAIVGLESTWRLHCKHGQDTIAAERACWAREQLMAALNEQGVDLWP